MVNMFFFPLFLTVPERIHSLTPSHPENNEIDVSCIYAGRFHGEYKKYHARLYLGDDRQLLKEETENTCKFVFKDLSYLTTYRVEVCIIHIFGDTK